MDSTTELKRRACAAIDASRDQIIGLGEEIMRNPETGFREFKTEARVVETMEELGLSPSRGLAVTGAKAMLKSITAARRWHSSANWTACVFPITHLRTKRPARHTRAATTHRLQACWVRP